MKNCSFVLFVFLVLEIFSDSVHAVADLVDPPFVIRVRNNAALSGAERGRLGRYVAQSAPGLTVQLDRAGPFDARFSVVPVYEDDNVLSGPEGSSFIVADSREGVLLNHCRQVPFNYQYNPTVEKSPRLYLVSNIHVLKPDNEYVTRYTFEFHFRKTRLGAIREDDDFKIGLISILKANLGIETHPYEDDDEIDLAWVCLNPLLDKLLGDPQLIGYTPSFTAFDTGWDFAALGVGDVGKMIAMYGFPDGAADRALNLPVRTEGTCSTDPKNLHCDTFRETLSTSGSDSTSEDDSDKSESEEEAKIPEEMTSVIDFKMDMTDLGGASGSPVIIRDEFTGRDLLLGINFAAKRSLLGYAIHASRLKLALEGRSDVLAEEDEGDAPFTPPTLPEAAAGGGAAGAGAGGGGPRFTLDDPQLLNLTLGRAGDLFSLVPEEVADVVRSLHAGPSILRLVSNGLTDAHITEILSKISTEGLLGNIHTLDVSGNRLRSLSVFNELVLLPTLKYLVIDQNDIDVAALREFFESPDAQSKGIIISDKSRKGFLTNAIKAGIKASLPKHQEYWAMPK